jgi:HK97 family phage prohead protease
VADNVISGFAIRYNSETVIANEFRERIAPGALTRTLKENPDVVMILAHDSGRILGRVSAGTLSLREDRAGLYFSLQVDPTTPEGQTALGTVGRQDVKGCSFGMRVRAETWNDGGDRLPLRTITDLDLYELTLTGFPAYESTSASLRYDNASAAQRRMREKMKARGLL